MLSVFYARITEELAALHAYTVPVIGEQHVRTHEPIRMVFIPSDDQFSATEGPGGNPRPLMTAGESSELVIRGPTTDHVQGMRDQFLIALHRTMKKANAGKSRGGRYAISKGRWTRNTFIAKNGFEYRLTFTIFVPIVERNWLTPLPGDPPQEPTASTYTLPDANTYPTVKPESVDVEADELDTPTVAFSIVPP